LDSLASRVPPGEESRVHGLLEGDPAADGSVGKGVRQLFSAGKQACLCIAKQNSCRPALLRCAPAAALRLAVQARPVHRLFAAKAAMGAATTRRR
jgi:hypothetical protein